MEHSAREVFLENSFREEFRTVAGGTRQLGHLGTFDLVF